MEISLPKLPEKLKILFANKEMPWQEAKDWCEAQGGRLPTKFELQVLAESGNVSKGRQDYFYWSAFVLSYDPTYAWNVYLRNGYTYGYVRASSLSVLCVKEELEGSDG